MPTRDTRWPAGTPCWIDYGAADLDAAKAFYANLLGWSYSGGEPEFGGYLTAEKNGLAAAGMAPQMDPADPPRWTTYFATDDADATAARITAAGGTVLVPPMDVGPMGRMAISQDPQGHPFGLWQAGQQPGMRIYNEPGSLVWNDAAVDDPAPRRVDENGAPLHQAELAFADQVLGLGVQRRLDRDEVGRPEQLLELY